jgi:hypothetical protein
MSQTELRQEMGDEAYFENLGALQNEREWMDR